MEYEKGLQGRITQDRGIRLARILRGVGGGADAGTGPMLRSGEARRTGSFTEALQEVYATPARLMRKDRNQLCPWPAGVARGDSRGGRAWAGRCSANKGPGEMNPEPALGDDAGPPLTRGPSCR